MRNLLATVDPRTGEPIRPIGYWRNGRPIWPVMGGSGEDDKPDDEKESDDKSDDKPDDDSTSDDDEDKDGDKVSRRDYQSVIDRMKAADRRAAAAEAKVKEQEDKDKSELQKSTDRVAELEKTNIELTTQIREMTLHNAFLSANDIVWHDPDDALALAEKKGLLEEAINDDGEVDRKKLVKALKELAKDKPHLVKSTKDNNDNGGAPTGSPVGSRKPQDQKEPSEADLRKRYRSLR